MRTLIKPGIQHHILITSPTSVLQQGPPSRPLSTFSKSATVNTQADAPNKMHANRRD